MWDLPLVCIVKSPSHTSHISNFCWSRDERILAYECVSSRGGMCGLARKMGQRGFASDSLREGIAREELGVFTNQSDTPAYQDWWHRHSFFALPMIHGGYAILVFGLSLASRDILNKLVDICKKGATVSSESNRNLRWYPIISFKLIYISSYLGY